MSMDTVVGGKRKVEEVESEVLKSSKLMSKVSSKSYECPYLDTINRLVLDFDFEKLCSISLSRINVYACLVCGKYFQGRGPTTHAYTHSVSDDVNESSNATTISAATSAPTLTSSSVGHRVFLNLGTKRFYCLPDNYEIKDPSLADIIYVLDPQFSTEMISRLESDSKEVRAFCGTLYLPGIVGLNNIKANDYCNVVLQALSHVKPIRDFFLANQTEDEGKKVRKRSKTRLTDPASLELVTRFGELMRKLWNPRNFKAHVSPHEMLQAVVLASKKRFQITQQGDAIDLLSWLLNALHIGLGGTKKADSSVIYRTFRGEMRIRTKKILPTDIDASRGQDLLATGDYDWKVMDSPFLYLTAELPPPPLFKDEHHENIIPQVSLFNLLAKFSGQLEKEYKTYKDNFLKTFELTKLPPYIILYIQRFTKNTFFVEKNPTIVNFPVKSIDFGELLSPASRLKHKGVSTKYDLMANIVHDGLPKGGTYKVHVLHKGSGKWFEMQDLHIAKVLPEILTLSESYIQLYRRTDL